MGKKRTRKDASLILQTQKMYLDVIVESHLLNQVNRKPHKTRLSHR